MHFPNDICFVSVEKESCASWTSGLTQYALVMILHCTAALCAEEDFNASCMTVFKGETEQADSTTGWVTETVAGTPRKGEHSWKH